MSGILDLSVFEAWLNEGRRGGDSGYHTPVFYCTIDEPAGGHVAIFSLVGGDFEALRYVCFWLP